MKKHKPRSLREATNRLVARLDGLDALAFLAEGLTCVEKRKSFRIYRRKMVEVVNNDYLRDIRGF